MTDKLEEVMTRLAENQIEMAKAKKRWGNLSGTRVNRKNRMAEDARLLGLGTERKVPR